MPIEPRNLQGIRFFEVNGLYVPSAPIPQFHRLRMDATSANTVRKLNLASVGGTLQPLTVQFSPQVANQSIDFLIKNVTGDQYLFSLNSNYNPYQFPPLVLEETAVVEVTPKFNINWLIVTCQFASLASTFSFA
jgi:hypothetical protein